ncbi:hypothetical protein SSX86_019421 [Deinandra increscens subsp. villosa]|uniref:Glutathione transferase n=1 Tax=Deinandra increscens subsp. villosa TaxID=3103831 RepID=A0AAP0GX85_9ASTR
MADGNQEMKLYSHPMSSCSRRVRLALNLKGLSSIPSFCIRFHSKFLTYITESHFLVTEIRSRICYEPVLKTNLSMYVISGLKYDCINILSIGDPEILKVNPMGFVPALVDGTTVVADSYAIFLYLEEKYPQHALLPQDIMKKSINYQVASIVSSSIQPLQNTSLVHSIGEIVSPDEKLPWAQYHIRKGFIALEKLLANHAGKYATGDEIYLADLYLAFQLDNAINRFNLDMTEFPLLLKLHKMYHQTPSFQQIFTESLEQNIDKSLFNFTKPQEA